MLSGPELEKRHQPEALAVPVRVQRDLCRGDEAIRDGHRQCLDLLQVSDNGGAKSMRNVVRCRGAKARALKTP